MLFYSQFSSLAGPLRFLKQFDLYLHSTTAAHDRQRDLKSIHAALYI